MGVLQQRKGLIAVNRAFLIFLFFFLLHYKFGQFVSISCQVHTCTLHSSCGIPEKPEAETNQWRLIHQWPAFQFGQSIQSYFSCILACHGTNTKYTGIPCYKYKIYQNCKYNLRSSISGPAFHPPIRPHYPQFFPHQGFFTDGFLPL